MDSVQSGVANAKAGKRDLQTVVAGGGRAAVPRIAGVRIVELGNVLTRSGSLIELFRADWPQIDISPQQINWNQLNANGVTDWHRHDRQTDHLIGIGGNIRLALWDQRENSPTQGVSEIIRLGALRPVVAVVPPGIWHGLRNESGAPSGYLNIIDQVYDYTTPDNWRLSPGTPGIPDIL